MKSDGQAPEQLSPSPDRLLCLDAFRGLVIVTMLVVNVAGTDAAFPTWFAHRGWNAGRMGNGLADYVFPWFLFAVGSAIPFSMRSGRGRTLTTPAKARRALRRGITIYLLGTLLWCATIGYRPHDAAAMARWGGPITWRVFLHWDILPLIGWSYFLGVILYLYSPRPSIRLAFVVIVLIAKFLILRVVPHPEASGQVVWEQTSSVQHWINARLGWPGVAITQGLPATACVIAGSFAGEWLGRRDLAPVIRVQRLLVTGLLCYVTGVVLHLTGLMPSSKDFFTSSYVLCTTGTAAAILAALMWLSDVRGWTLLTPLRVFGTNALTIYLGAELLWKMVLMRWEFANPTSIGGSSVAVTAIKAHLHAWFGATAGSCALVAIWVSANWAAAWMLFRRKIFIRV